MSSYSGCGELRQTDAHAANSRIYGRALWICLPWDLRCQGCLPSAMTNNGAEKFLNQDHESTNHKPARIEELCQHDEAKRSVACRSHPGSSSGGQLPGSMAPPVTLCPRTSRTCRPRLWLGRFQIQVCSLKPTPFQSRMSCHHRQFLHGGTLMARQLRCGPPGPRTEHISSHSPAAGAGPVHPLSPLGNGISADNGSGSICNACVLPCQGSMGH